MIDFQDVVVRYGAQEVLAGVSFRIHPGERVGIVGPNGSGKSTLYRLLLGERLPDGGTVTLSGKPRIGHVRQHLAAAHDEETLVEYALRGVPHLHDLEQRLHALEAQATVAAETERPGLLREIGALQSRFEHEGGYRLETQAKAALGGLGFPVADFGRPFRAFSGGWQMRAELARVLAAEPDLLLLDEPSNYLDLPAVEWLLRFLRGFDGTLLLISHDRHLLRSLTRLTLEVDAGTVTRYAGDLDYYLRERDVRYANLLAARQNQDRRREQIERFIERFKAKNTKASQAQSRQRMLERMEEIRLPRRSQSAGGLRLPPAAHCGAEVARLESAGFSYDGTRWVFRDVDLSIGRGEKLAVVGYNGMGKTTLLRLLAGERPPTAGRAILGHRVLPGYQSQELAETIPPEVTVLGCVRRAAPDVPEKTLRTQLGGFGFTADDIDKPSRVLSGGERIRLAFARLYLAAPNFLLLDEPTTHLDMEGRRALEEALIAYDGTVCLVSHDVAFVRAVANGILEITPSGVKRFLGGYDDYREKAALVAGPLEAAAPVRAGLTPRELRRARARERAVRQPRLRELRETVATAEAQIARLEAERNALERDINAGAAATDYAGSCRRFHRVVERLEEQTAVWERAATELQSLEREQAEAQEAIAAGDGD